MWGLERGNGRGKERSLLTLVCGVRSFRGKHGSHGAMGSCRAKGGFGHHWDPTMTQLGQTGMLRCSGAMFWEGSTWCGSPTLGWRVLGLLP